MKWSVTVCPTCGGPSRVVDSRTQKRDEGAVRRRRACEDRKCGRRWTTLEVLAEDAPPSRKALGRALGSARMVENLLRGMLGGAEK